MNENGGQALIPVGVLGGTLQREVVVNFSTSDSTATGKPNLNCMIPNVILAISDGNDYNKVQSMLLTFGPMSNRSEIPVTIINNNVYELTEKFNGILSFPQDPVPKVALSPKFNAMNVTILDDDG